MGRGKNHPDQETRRKARAVSQKRSDAKRCGQRQPGESPLDFARRCYRRKPLKTVEDVREYLDLNAEYDATGCLISTLGRKGAGYTQIRVFGRFASAHRLKYELWLGPIPDDLVVMHTCDTPACINLAHLKLGTRLENQQDMVRKGRGLRGRKLGPNPATQGENNAHAKLTEDAVRAIRTRYKRGMGRAIAKEYNVTPSVISNIVNHHTWTHI